ncbi:MAG: LacI family DNA-binding transcriptional regulator [Granulicella sp.]
MAPNQKELAKLAGVSAGTVSNVISGSTRVGERSRQKVLEAIQILGYQPNLIARSLRTNRTHTLGIVVPDITIPFFPKIIRGAESAARERGYFLIVLDSEGNPEREADMIALLRAQRVEGILLVTASSPEQSSDRLASLTTHSPLVCLDRLPVDLDVDSVCVDGCGAAIMAVDHLVERGHTRIACITGPLTLQNEKERLRGYRQALKKHGLPELPSLIWSSGFEQQEIARATSEGLRLSGEKPSALLATNGVTGLAALRSLYADGLSTPKDFAFVTFDEITAEDFFRPGVTSVVQPTYDMGYQAVEVLLKRFENGNADMPCVRVRLPASLLIRESSSTSYIADASKIRTHSRKAALVV